MVFTDIRLQNFRSYKDSSFELGKGVTIVVGPNAAGKTNLLEATMLAAIGRTYRSKYSLIKKGKDWARIDIHTDKNNLRTIKIVADRNNIEAEIDNKPYKRLPFNQKQPIVIFEPNHLLMVGGEPGLRREYLDELIDQLNPGFSKIKSTYKRALAQRNRLLKQPNIDTTLLFALNIRLSESAAQIVKKRTDLIKEINKNLSNIYSQVADKKSKLEMNYISSVNDKNYSASLLKTLDERIELDKLRGFTSAGPHRDDFIVSLSDEDIGGIGSRGEARTLLLTLKVIELQLLETIIGTKPLLLLDDVFSELDGARRKALVGFLKDHQTIITTTDADIVTKNFSQNCQIIPLG